MTLPADTARNKEQTCSVCRRRFTAYTWERRHVHPGLADAVHARCCPQCHGAPDTSPQHVRALEARLACVTAERDDLRRRLAVVAGPPPDPPPAPVVRSASPLQPPVPAVWPIT